MIQKFTITCFLLCLSFYSLSQNWQLINKDYEYHYAANDNVIPDFSIRIDSIHIEGMDTVFYFNRVVMDCDTCSIKGSVYFNYPGLFDYSCVKNAGRHTFKPYKNFMIDVNKPIGASWTYSDSLNITASVIEKKAAEIFQNPDSLLIISLSNNDTIQISKKFGIIRFPDIENGNTYQLLGLKKGTDKFGAVAADCSSIFDFDVGDEFYYSEGSSCFCEVTPTSRYSHYKLEIVDKEIIGDTIKYFQIKKGFRYSKDFGIPYGDTLYFNEPYISVYVEDETNPTNLFNGEKFSYEGFLSYVRILRDETDNTIVKRIGNSDNYDVYNESQKNYLFYEYDYDDQFGLNTPFIAIPILNYLGFFYYEWKEGVGLVDLSYQIFEAEYKKKLVGYKKGNVSSGTIYPDNFLTGNNIQESGKNISVFPSVFKSSIFVEAKRTDNFNVTIYSISGYPVYNGMYRASGKNEIHLQNLKNGLYLIKIESGNFSLTRKILKIN